jgi:type IV pilus assembly protein PilZ
MSSRRSNESAPPPAADGALAAPSAPAADKRDKRDSPAPPEAMVSEASGSIPPVSSPLSSPDRGHERRSYERFEVTWSVDCVTDDTFLYASIANISEMGIFVQTIDPLPVGTQLTLRFAPPSSADPFVLRGTVQWVNAIRPLSDNPNPGMGVRFIDLSADDRERIVETIRTIAYLRESPND